MRSSATPRIMVAMLAATTSFIGAVHAQYCSSEELEYWCDGVLTNEVTKCLPLLYGVSEGSHDMLRTCAVVPSIYTTGYTRCDLSGHAPHITH